MALTDIARQLKELFSGFGSAAISPSDVERFRAKYGDVETIRIGEMDYIVINEEYQSVDSATEAQNVSPLFYNSINNKFAVIDTETSSTLIDEVYSRITYIQRVSKVDALPSVAVMRESLSGLVGDEASIDTITVYSDAENVDYSANIFECQLVKDTGVSASPDAYTFMIKSGEIKEIPASVMHQVARSEGGKLNILKDHEVLNENRDQIQRAVYEKYTKDDVDIQSVTVKSIFEISLSFKNIGVKLRDEVGRRGEYHTSYIASANNEFAALNTSIHTCNICLHELVDVKDPSLVSHLHINMDAYDGESGEMFAVGCEDCLVQCPECGGWHYDYEKFLGTSIYNGVRLRPGREFIKSLRSLEDGCNYCACREGIDWIYDEMSGSTEEHGVILKEKMVFINTAFEKLASFAEFEAFYEQRRLAEEGKKSELKGAKEGEFALKTIARFKQKLASQFDIDVKDIRITTIDGCRKCNTCGGEYYRGEDGAYDYDFRCGVCDELVGEKRHMLTRSDGLVFMRRVVGKKQIVSKYVMTKLGNLRKISSYVLDTTTGDGTEVAEEPVQKKAKGKN